MRLLTVIPDMAAGGAQVVAATLSAAAAAHGHDVRLASGPGFRVAELADRGVAHLPVPLDSRDPRDLARTVLLLRAAARTARPDLVHAHNPKAALAARVALGRSVPVVTTLHGVPARELGSTARILRRASDRVVAVSPYVAAQLEVYGYPGDRIDVVENAVETPAAHDREAARAELGIAPGALVAVCPARLVDQKRHDLLVEAWARLAPDAVLLVAGDGPNRAAIEDRVRRLGLETGVRLLGERSDVPRLLAAADLLVLSTDWEGLPISILEAMAVGLPVVVSRVGGVVETLGNAVRLVEPGSVDALAEALSSLAADAGERAALGERARRLVADRFGPQRMLDAHRDIYARLLPAPALVGSGA